MEQFLNIVVISILFSILGFGVALLVVLIYNAATKIKAPVYQYKETVDMHRLRRQPAPSITREETADGHTGLSEYEIH
jgi:predicted cobalt transporter CbtA